ncbi:type II toxin-antitoxin system prevent-host-death family antitoxin [Aquibium carbonis]|uniref:Antitoxin n=1 Tax=Aquibium carbonis TaxID=2495581 RepID=A0A3R9Y4W3_9HYPH|nr:type II toxin-antitoxin system prevent-host-death family antitoxin [Aquibium carbonis]RST84298.1 type II toxin-antitoxin system prevent-host-death family antitoxin [Aquibium carbonis]
MDETVSAADANRRFSRILQGVQKGNTYVVTSHGRPLARILPVEADDGAKAAARSTLLTRLARQPVVDAGRWSRDELYED